MIAALLFAAASPEALDLGRDLARSGFLATLGPLQTGKETEDLIKDHPELSAVEQDKLRAIAKQKAEELSARVIEVEAKAYAESLAIGDLRVLAAHAKSPAALHQRAAMPKIIGATVGSLSGLDYKGSVIAAFCAETGKACPER